MTHYIGRFAPSPTGSLHIGSLVAALASYLDAKTHQGKWLVRIEDIDLPRNVPNADREILRALEILGLHWDGDVLYQSKCDLHYQRAFQHLIQKHLVYPCTCTRKEIADSTLPHQRHTTPIYPGTCRLQLKHHERTPAWRIKVSDACIAWQDRKFGCFSDILVETVGDFVLKRADGIWAYQLAAVVDDAAQGITHIVRGADLLESTARQVFIQESLGFKRPYYCHVPLVLARDGQKLSKQNGAQALNLHKPLECLQAAARHLGLNIQTSTLHDFWLEALCQWDLRFVQSLQGDDASETPHV